MTFLLLFLLVVFCNFFVKCSQPAVDDLNWIYIAAGVGGGCCCILITIVIVVCVVRRARDDDDDDYASYAPPRSTTASDILEVSEPMNIYQTTSIADVSPVSSPCKFCFSFCFEKTNIVKFSCATKSIDGTISVPNNEYNVLPDSASTVNLPPAPTDTMSSFDSNYNELPACGTMSNSDTYSEMPSQQQYVGLPSNTRQQQYPNAPKF